MGVKINSSDASHFLIKNLSAKQLAFDDDKLVEQVAKSVPLQPVIWPALAHLDLKLYCHRNDLISSAYSGNKFYKLFFNLRQAIRQGKTHVLSFGGGYSNHLFALAAIGAELGISTIGVIRGLYSKELTPTLKDAQHWGMRLCFTSKSAYAHKTLDELPDDIRDLIHRDCVAIIPEGGANLQGVRGATYLAMAIAARFNHQPYYCCSATATGTTLAGLVAASPPFCRHIGISVLKGEETISQTIAHHLQTLGASASPYRVETAFHCGGYAKVNDELLAFIDRFESLNAVPLDPVYTGKMMLAVEKLALKGHWPAGSHIVTIHTGGLQGRRGFKALAEKTA